jgi:hypothetical protein
MVLSPHPTISLLFCFTNYLQPILIQKCSGETDFPVFTLKVLNWRTYIIRSPDLVEAVLRNPRSFTFPLGVLFSKRSLAGTERVLDVLEFVPTAKSESSCTQDVHAALYGPMGQDEVKAGMNARLLGNLAEYLNKLGGEGEGDKIELFGWVKDVITKATAGALYGPSNPIATDSSLVDSLWYILPSPSLPSTNSSFLQLWLHEETYK